MLLGVATLAIGTLSVQPVLYGLHRFRGLAQGLGCLLGSALPLAGPGKIRSKPSTAVSDLAGQ